MISATIAAELTAGTVKVSEPQVAAALKLLAEGNTVPFIARYRKEATGGLDDTQLRTIEERNSYLTELAERKETITAAIAEQGKLTDELAAAIAACDTKARLEDLYLPYKKRRRTKADKAREAGLEQLLDDVLADRTIDPVAAAEKFVTEGYGDSKAVLDGAKAIVIDRMATDADLVGQVRDTVWQQGEVTASVVAGQEDSGKTFRDYFDHTEDLRTAPGHRVLAMLRGETEGVLTLGIDAGDDLVYQQMVADAMDLHPTGGASDDWVAECVRSGWRTKLRVSTGVDIRMQLREKAEADAVGVFARNLKDLLLAAPAGQRATLGLDPGYRNGVKCAVVDQTGQVLDTVIVYPHSGKWDQSRDTLAKLAATHRVELIAVGNGTASRETDKLAGEVADMIAAAGGARPNAVVVSESGASVYSASELAAQEFPEMDVSLRGAVSIARRLQDPLAELVKIDPKSIGVGQYQHDVSQTKLARALDAVVEDAVNAVGVEVNTASAPLLRRVAGITETMAQNIVAYRNENGAFASRMELLKVPRLGPKAFEQCAGFLRIHGAKNPLDASAVHPESYGIAEAMAKQAGTDVAGLIGNSRLLATLKPSDFATAEAGIPTIEDILAELDKPGRDPRPEFKTATFKAGVEKPSDLVPGMILEGTVTNVAAFGAFVDIGVHQDGLVHISQLADRYVADPHDVVKSGQVVKVRVQDVDIDRGRISLTMKLADEQGGGSRGGQRGRQRSDARDGGQSRGGGQRGGRGGRGNQRGGQSSPGGGSMADALRKAGFGQ
ncbi:Tex family protein [Corynebacterium ulceribovis]|uniref:Tex family protein n=1 Tax=Corynebacterium ulceribovis TaxID=487732 RepID=UPI0003816021|nr:Tex family protein [Corynebacterium ulceribovis]